MIENIYSRTYRQALSMHESGDKREKILHYIATSAEGAARENALKLLDNWRSNVDWIDSFEALVPEADLVDKLCAVQGLQRRTAHREGDAQEEAEEDPRQPEIPHDRGAWRARIDQGVPDLPGRERDRPDGQADDRDRQERGAEEEVLAH